MSAKARHSTYGNHAAHLTGAIILLELALEPIADVKFAQVLHPLHPICDPEATMECALQEQSWRVACTLTELSHPRVA